MEEEEDEGTVSGLIFAIFLLSYFWHEYFP